MTTRKQVAELPVYTVVEHDYISHGRPAIRWLVLNSRGGQSSLTFHHLDEALKWAAWTTLSWELWVTDDTPFCK